ncbi:MAG: tRNA pseudouridine(55) synthase TruB [Clostridiales bacterium]|nr:tRNA pseudouridine(55) synthase TruB [Clostridiales bacterium]
MLNGFINLNKTKGMSSAKAVAKLNNLLKSSGADHGKIGHLGTLDPDAEGVLPVALGRATRLFNYFLDKKKVYYTEFVFGKTTDTLDESGKITDICDKIPDFAAIEAALPSFTGRISQIPPEYSAIQVNGQRAYELARTGKDFYLKARDVDIYNIKLLESLCGGVYSFRIECGGGTYIRSIARDLGLSLGSLAYMRYLKRLQSGPFSIESAYTLDELAEGAIKDKIVPLEKVVKETFPAYHLDGSLAAKALNGVRVTAKGMPNKDFALYIGGELIGIACSDAKGGLNIKTRLI